MGYFSNGTEGELFEYYYCYRCIHTDFHNVGEAPPCPIWMLHMNWNYEQFKDDTKKTALNYFIVKADDGHPQLGQKCLMFSRKQ